MIALAHQPKLRTYSCDFFWLFRLDTLRPFSFIKRHFPHLLIIMNYIWNVKKKILLSEKEGFIENYLASIEFYEWSIWSLGNSFSYFP